MKRQVLSMLALMTGLVPLAQAVNFPGAFSETFDSMGTAGTTPPTGWSVYGAFSGGSTTFTTTIPASGIAAGSATTTLTAATAYTATSNTNGFNYATTTATADRSLGTSPTTGPGVALQLSLTNTTGAAVNSLQVRYDTRRFNSVATANELPGYWLFYSLDNGATWTSASATNPTITTVPNTAGVTTLSPTTITLGSAWANNGTLLFRWVDDNSQQTSPDQVIGLDNVSIATPPATAGKTSLFLNGANQYATMGAATATLGASSFTLECWFQRTGAGTITSTGTGGATSAIPLVTKGRGEAEGSNVDCNYFLGIDSTTNKLCADFEAQTGVSGITAGQNYPVFGNTVISSNVWHHAAATYDAATFTWNLYLDGVLDATLTNPTGAAPRNDSIQHFGIGSAFTSAGVAAGFFQGMIDEARVWNVARPLSLINAARNSEITTSATGLLACYGMNEGSGTSVGVVVSGAPSGTVANSPLWVSGAPAVTDIPPTVSLTSPTSGSSVIFPGSISLAATAADSDGTVAKVEFFNGSTKLGEALTAPYAYTWSGAAVGSYTLSAVATDNLGVSTASSTITIEVIPNPNQPVVVTVSSPANNATGIGSSTTLNLDLADNENDAQTVNYFGRVTTPTVAGADFTFIAIPDTQYYSENTNRNPSTTGNPLIDTGANASIYNAQTQWVVNNRSTLNIPFVSHMGDIAQNGDANESEWIVADGAMARLENPASTLRAHGIPWGVAPGNHDQQPVADAGGVTNFYTKYFNFTRWDSRPYYGGHYGMKRTLTSDPAPNYQANTNNYQLFSSGGLDFIIVHLEYDARSVSNYQPVLDWADALLKAYPNRRAIITSHWIINTGNPATFSTQGQAIYDNLKDNPNLFLLLCGHVNGEGRRADTFEGRTVYSILSDYQESKNGGNGFLRKLTFKPSQNKITVESYSPTLNRSVDATDGVPSWTATYDLTYNMQSSLTSWIPLGSVNVPASGTSASLNWTGLEAGKNYEWYATSNDGVNTTTTATNRFLTTAPSAPVVTLDSPSDGSTAALGSTISLTATATDTDGTIAKVEFFDAGKKLGEDNTAPYSISLSNPTPGSHPLTAVATDNSGLDSISAVATISVTNAAPVVTLADPDESESFGDAPASIHFEAIASDSDGTIAKVEFYANSTKVGESIAPSIGVDTFTFDWTTAFTGTYLLTARAIDSFGAATTSTEVRTLYVTNADNIAPAVTLTLPTVGSDYAVGSAIPLAATAIDTDGTITKIEFYQGATKLGEDTSAPFTYSWTGALTGSYSVTAVATDNDGGTASSSAAAITISAAGVRSIASSIMETFDSIGASGTAPPNGWSMKYYGTTNAGTNATWTDSIPIPGTGAISVASQVATTAGLTVNNAPTATNINGYNAQGATSTDRVLATSPTTGAGVSIQAQLRNNTGSSVSSVNIGYDIRRYLAVGSANELPGYWLFYSLDNGTTWTNVTALNPTVAGPSGVVVPNTVGVTTVPVTTIALSSVWSNGSDLLLRWVDDNAVATSPDQIVGLDNVSISPVTTVGAAPSVALTAPLTTDSFLAPTTVSLAASASDSDGSVSKVEFYNGATKLGEDLTSPYTYDWTSVAAGSYNLSARATDNDGNVSSSSVVAITVAAPPSSGTLTRGPYLNQGNQNSIVIRWRTSQSVVGRVRYGTSSSNLDQVTNEARAKTDHEVKLTGLSPYTRYYYSVGSAYDTLTPQVAETTSFTPGAPAPTSADYTFRTSPVPGTAVNARIWIVGDCGRGTQAQANGRDAYYSYNGSTSFIGTRIPDLNLQMGDNAYNSGTDTEYQSGYFSMYANIFRKMPQWSCLGNHDANNGSTSTTANFPYFDMFTFPTAGECGGVASGTERYYSFDYGNIHFICLDSQASNTSVDNPATTTVNEDGPMATWLRADLASNTATWTIAFWHHPPYSKGSHNSDSEGQMVTMRTNFNPILEAGGVDLLYFGHSHNYERSVLLDGHYGTSDTLTSGMKVNSGNGSITGFTSGSSGVIRNSANGFAATATVNGTVIPGNGAYIKPLTGPRDHFGAVYNTAGMSGLADAGSINHSAMYICYNTVGTVNLDVNGNTLTSTFVQSGGAVPDNFTITKQGAADTDHDGVSDEYEIAHGMSRYSNDATADSDSDGVSNFAEYAFGLNAAVSDAAPLSVNVEAAVINTRGQPTTWLKPTASGTDYRVIFTRRKDAASNGLTYTPQFSADLASWVNSTATPAVIADGGEIEAVSIRYPSFINGRKPRFFRVSVSAP